MQKITPFLWFDTQAEEAANYYVSLFGEGSRIVDVTRYTELGPGPKGSVMTVAFELRGQKFVALNGGPAFKFTEAISLVINCDSQAEVDRFWDRILKDGGKEIECGWIKDRYGLSWQVVPSGIWKLFNDPDPKRVRGAMQAMMTMKKLDLDGMRRGADAAK